MIRQTGSDSPQLWRHELHEYYASLLRQLRSANDHEQTSVCLGLTSCLRREGVTTVAANLARCAAVTDRRRVLLVDANTSQPAIARTLNVDAAPGFREWLNGESLDSCIRATDLANLFVLPTVAFQAVYLDTLPERVHRLHAEFDFVVFDLPTANDVTSCMPIASMLDGVLLVVEAERVEGETLLRAKQRLQHAHVNLMGAVFNKRRGQGAR